MTFRSFIGGLAIKIGMGLGLGLGIKIAISIVIGILVLAGESLAAPGMFKANSEEQVFAEGYFHQFEGGTIEKIVIHGLTRTSETAVRRLLGNHEGQEFSSAQWIEGIKKLYNTLALYDIETKITKTTKIENLNSLTPSSSSTTTTSSLFSLSPSSRLQIHLHLREKWTLVPFVYFQGGGGYSNLGGGLFDRNLGGYFTNACIGAASLNGTLSYELSLYQEWFLDTNLIFGLELSHLGVPVVVQDQAGAQTQSFIWTRTAQQLLFGNRFGSQIRLFSYLEVFRDTMFSQDAQTQAQVYTHTQYRIRPHLILGRSNLTNYLEEGHELTLAPTFTNFFDSNSSYSQGVVRYKLMAIVPTVILPGDTNLALNTSGGVMSLAPLPYQFRLGGFDRVRGFSMNRFIGNAYLNTHLEVRPTLWKHEFNWDFLNRVILQGCLFSDLGWIYGSTHPTGQDPNSIYTTYTAVLASVGTGFRVIFAKYSHAILRFDWAQTLTPREGVGFSFGIGQFF